MLQVLANEEVMAYLNDVICHLNSDLHCICKRSWMAVAIVTIVTIVWVTIIIYNPNLATDDSLQLYLSQGTQWLYFPANAENTHVVMMALRWLGKLSTFSM